MLPEIAIQWPPMTPTHSANPHLDPQTKVLLAILDNQIARTHAALEDLDPAHLDKPWEGQCQTIRGIIGHLRDLRGFQLLLLQSPLQAQLPKLSATADLAEITQVLDEAAELVCRAIETHDPADWFAPPTEARPGPWADEPTLIRVSRPINDFANHLGAIRALRRILGNPAKRTQ